MTRLKLTRERLEQTLARVPEGLIDRGALGQRVDLRVDLAPVTAGAAGQWQDWFFDRARLTLDAAREQSAWCRPVFPEMNRLGEFVTPPVAEQRARRATRVQELHDTRAGRLLAALDASPGYLPVDELCPDPVDRVVLDALVLEDLCRLHGGYAYDPLRLSQHTVRHAAPHASAARELIRALRAAPDPAGSLEDLTTQFGQTTVRAALKSGWVHRFDVHWTADGSEHTAEWLCAWGRDPGAAAEWALAQSNVSAAERRRRIDARWAAVLERCGNVLRPDAHDGRTAHAQVVARSYLLAPAAQRLGVPVPALERALQAGELASFHDPDNELRLPAHVVETAAGDPGAGERLNGYQTVKARDIALVGGVPYSTARRRLEKADLDPAEPLWNEVRGRWGLPATWHEFRELRQARRGEWREELHAAEAAAAAVEEARQQKWRAREERRLEAQAALRAKLVAAFPAWQHEGRAAQRLVLHAGPPNSGKTHAALDALARAGSGWYLAPLRLLAFEVFDRLNGQGVPCNLLTGEESIPVPGAQITAATIEMFSARESGACVVVDEAQMLADVERGWAWTRALMEARAPLLHVIAPPHAERLVRDLAAIATLPVETEWHERLAPIRVAAAPWPLGSLRRRTILVTFSRRNVLALKMALEELGRTVAVVYGDLPPEVRRRQADRFIAGEASICVATDAVGMGMNLPADAVCFFEVEKFDGQALRDLTPAEVQQIGGRAGRFGLSEGGEVGAVSARVLRKVREQFHAQPGALRFARVAPSLADLELIPGALAERLIQWSALRSIPEHLRRSIAVADLQERIELAQLLSEPEVRQLGLGAALKLVNAPTRQETRAYWRACVTRILRGEQMPLPEGQPELLRDRRALELAETAVHAADVYLWLSQRPEFALYGLRHEPVRHDRAAWSRRIDDALAQRGKLDVAPRCSACGKKLPLGHRYGLCEACYLGRQGSGWW